MGPIQGLVGDSAPSRYASRGCRGGVRAASESSDHDAGRRSSLLAQTATRLRVSSQPFRPSPSNLSRAHFDGSLLRSSRGFRGLRIPLRHSANLIAPIYSSTASTPLYGASANYLESLYTTWQKDRSLVDSSLSQYFENVASAVTSAVAVAQPGASVDPERLHQE